MPRTKKQTGIKTLPKSKSKQAQQAEHAPRDKALLADLKEYNKKAVIIVRNLLGIQDTLSSKSSSEEEKKTKENSYQRQKEAFNKEKQKWFAQLSLLIDQLLILEESLRNFRSILFYLVKTELLLGKADDAHNTFIELERTFFGIFKDKSIIYWNETCTIKAILYSCLAYRAAFVNEDMPSSIVFLLSIPSTEKWQKFNVYELDAVYEYLLSLCSRNQNPILINKANPDFLKIRGDALTGDEFYYDLKSPSAPKLEIFFTQAAQHFQENIIDLAFDLLSKNPTEGKTDDELYRMLLVVKTGLRAMLSFLKNPMFKSSHGPWLQRSYDSLSSEQRNIIELFLEKSVSISNRFLLKEQKQEESSSSKKTRDEKQEESSSSKITREDEEKEEDSSVETNRDEKREESSEQITRKMTENRRSQEDLGKLCFDLGMICESYLMLSRKLAEEAYYLNLSVSSMCQHKVAAILAYNEMECLGKEPIPAEIREGLKNGNSPSAKYYQAVELIQKNKTELDTEIEGLLIDCANQEFLLAYIKLGEFYFSRGNTELSEEYYRKAEDVDNEIVNIRIAHSIYFMNKDEAKEKKAVCIWENAKDSGFMDAVWMLIYYNLSKILPVTSIRPFKFVVDRDITDWPNPQVDPLLNLKQEHILRSIGLCMEAYVLDTNQRYTKSLHKSVLHLFYLSIYIDIFTKETIEKLKIQIENLFLCFPLLRDKYVADLNWIIAIYRKYSSAPLEINQSQDAEGSEAKSKIGKIDSLRDPFMPQPDLGGIFESVISLRETVLKETSSVKGHISMLLSQMKAILRSAFNGEQYMQAGYERNRESLKKLFLELNSKMEGVADEISLYDLKSIIEIVTKLQINSNAPIFKSCLTHVEKTIKARIRYLDLSKNSGLSALMIRCLYSLCSLKEIEAKRMILDALILTLKGCMEKLNFDLISKFSYSIAIGMANHKNAHGEDSVLPDMFVKAVCLLQEPAVREKLKKAQNEAHLHQFILATKFIALYLPDEMKPLMNCPYYQNQAHKVEKKVDKGQPSIMQRKIGLWLEEEQYDIQHEYIIGILPADIYASYPRGAVNPTKFIVECNGYHHYYCNNLDEEFKGNRLVAMSEEDFESVHDSILEPTPSDIFKLAYKEKEGGVPIICISIPMYMRGKEYVMRYIQRKIAPLDEKGLSQPLLGMTKMRLFPPPPEAPEEKESMGCSMLPQSSHC